MASDAWHFPRRDFAARVLRLLTDGPAQAFTLFGARRTGKTEFLLKDLAVVAEARGHRVIYASFWQASLSPAAVLLHALETALGKGRGRGLRGLAPKLSFAVPGAKAEMNFAALGAAEKPPDDVLLHLDDLLERASRGRKPTLLLLDEAQELALAAGNKPLVAALRTSLDKRADRLKTVFTGSSRDGLAAMFSVRQAPFFHFATAIDLPRLGAPFVEHLLGAFQSASGRQLDADELLAAFERLHANPYFFRVLLEALLRDPALSVAGAMASLRERIAEELGYVETWLGLTPLQRAVAGALAANGQRPFSQPFRERVGRALREEPPSAAQVQAALRRLRRLGVADTPLGEWALADPEFAAWIREGGGLAE